MSEPVSPRGVLLTQRRGVNTLPAMSARQDASAFSPVNAAVSVSAVSIEARTAAHPDVHIVPIVHIANQTAAASDTSSLGNGTMRGPPSPPQPVDSRVAQQQPPQRRSTDTQTEALTTLPAAGQRGESESREQRRRERRERRAAGGNNRRSHPVNSATTSAPNPTASGMTANPAPTAAHLPDILNSHVPPPYSTLPPARGAPPPPPPPVVAPPPPPPGGRCYLPPPPPGSPQRTPLCFGDGYNLAGVGPRRLPYRTEEEDPKSCCGMLVTQSVSIRWFIVMIAFVGLCCAIVGTVLGALKATGREHLTVSLLMIGVGIVLITVSGIAWRLTSRDSPSCRVMLGLARPQEEADSRRFMHRVVPAYGRPHHPYAAMVYPEFQFRPPPPSYHASMQAYRLGLLLDRHNAQAQGHEQALSPPPSYRPALSAIRPGMNTLSRHSEYSHPPSYHSRQSSAHQQTAPEPPEVQHSRDPSVLSFLSHESLVFGAPLDGITSTDGVNVISVLQTGSLDDSKRKKRRERKRVELKEGRLEQEAVKREEDLVTIVQTDGSGHVLGDRCHVTDIALPQLGHVTAPSTQGPAPASPAVGHVTRSNSVVVTVSGSVERNSTENTVQTADGEVEIVAHL